MQHNPSGAEPLAKLGLEERFIDAATVDELHQVLAAPRDEHCGRALFLPLDILFIARRVDIADYALHNRMAR
jgi:hypothetical protein